MAPPSIIEPPVSYQSLTNSHIIISHHPTSSPTTTPVLVLALNRPNHNNAFTSTMEQELVQAYSMFDIDERVRCIVMTGAGRMFCAGADLDVAFEAQRDFKREEDHRDGGGKVALAIHNCSKPTIAAINGPAVGVGITMTLPATIRIACSTAKVGFVFSRRGIVMEACSSYFLPRLIGFSRALHLVTTGAVYPATDPLFRDLFIEVLPTPETTMERALGLAEEIVGKTSVVSTKLMRDMLYRGPDSVEGTHLLESRLLAGLFGSQDNAEGVKSFFEKRPPKFEGQIAKDAPSVYPWWPQQDNKPDSSRGKSKL